MIRKNIVSLVNNGNIDSILDKLNAYHAYVNNKDRQQIKSKTLHKYFKPLSLFQETKNQKDINEFFRFKTIELYFWISEEINVLLTNWMNLFYFYQVKDPYEASNLSEYGFYTFSGTENYMEIQASSAELLKSKEYKHIFPIFKTRQQFEDFSQWYTVRCYISHINETHYPNEIQGKIAKDIGSHILLKSEIISDQAQIKEETIDKVINEKFLILMNSDVYKEDQAFMRNNSMSLFLDRFKPTSLFPMILNKCVDVLEKSHEYKLASLILLHLLISRQKKFKRAKWWYRLTLDLDHCGK